MTLPDPIEGYLGQLVLTGWIGEAPTGQEEAYFLLTTPDNRARVTMPLIAAALGMNQIGQPVTDPDVCVTFSDDGWACLHTPGGERLNHPVSGEWGDIARQHGRVVLCVGYEPLPADMTVDEYTDLMSSTGRVAIGLVPVQ